MKIAARRRLAAGVVVTTSALVAGLVVAPALAAPNGLTITPTAVFNTNASQELTFESTDADFTYGGEAIFTRLGTSGSFTVPVDGGIDSPPPDHEGSATVDFTDLGNGLGNDGPGDAGTYSVSVTGEGDPITGDTTLAGGGNDTCTSCFTVLSPGPVAVTSVAPNSLRPNTQGNVSVLGNNFERGSRIAVLFPGGGVDANVNPNNAPTANDSNTGTAQTDGITTRTELKRRFIVAPNASPGVRDVSVTNLDGTTATCSGCFFVAGPALTSSTPAGGSNDPGQALTTITFSGPNVTNGDPRLEFVGNPGAVPRSKLAIDGQNVRNYTGTSITADYDLSNAAPGAYQPFVEGDNGVVNACDCRFTVLQNDNRQPTLTSLDRSTLAGIQKNLRQGETAEFVAAGTNFSKGATLLFDPPAGLTVTDVNFTSPEQLRVTIGAAADAPVGDKDVQVKLTDGKTSAACAKCLTVTAGSGAGASPTPSASSSASPQPGNQDFSFSRFAGSERYATAARIATGSYATAQTVLLANGESDDKRTTDRDESHFPDALAAAYLAGFRQAPTVLATQTTLPQPTKDALRSLQAQNVVIIGGPAAIGSSVENELKAAGYNVSRVFGQNRYDTAKAVAETPPVDYVGQDPNGDKTAVVASGERFPDALVAGPLGYQAKFPVLITAAAGLSDATEAALKNLGIQHVLIPGGTTAVSQQTEDEIKALGITVERFRGSGRSETAVLVAAYAYDQLGFDRAHVDLARGDEFPDALAGGPHAGVKQSPILLTANPDQLGTATEGFLRNRGSQLQEGHIFGGLAAVSQATEDRAEAAVRQGSSASPSPSASASSSASPSASGSAAPSSASPSASPSCTPGLFTQCPAASASPSASTSPAASGSPTASASATR